MATGYILIYPWSYHGNGIYLEYVPIVPFDVRRQSGICISYNMGTRGLPGIYTLGHWVYISGKPRIPML